MFSGLESPLNMLHRTRPSTGSLTLSVWDTKTDNLALPLPLDTPSRTKSAQSFSTSPRRRSALISLVALTILSFLSLSHSHIHSSTLTNTVTSESLMHVYDHLHHAASSARRKQVKLSAEEELAALVQFVTVQATNALPSNIDGDRPIDPVTICGFDTFARNAREEVEELVEDVWKTNPMVLFKNEHNPPSKALASLLSSLPITPSLVSISLNSRPDSLALTTALQRLTNTNTTPLLLIGGVPISQGDFDRPEEVLKEVTRLKENGELQILLQKAGVRFGNTRRLY